MGLHLGQQIWLVEVEGFAQFEPKRAGGGLVAGQGKLEDGGGPAVEARALGSGDKREAGLGGGRFERSDEGEFQFGGHQGESCVEDRCRTYCKTCDYRSRQRQSESAGSREEVVVQFEFPQALY